MELLGLSSLPIAVGIYLPISTSATMFAGGVVRWIVEQRSGATAAAESESGPGVLFSSGLIAGGAITGVVLAAIAVQHWDTAFNVGKQLGAIAENPYLAFGVFLVAIAVPLYRVGRRPS
jgi:uncharacterized oligopeptide transporter (OPT) family protein